MDKWYEILNVFFTYGEIEETELKEIVSLSMPTLRKNIEQLNEQLESTAKIQKNGTNYDMEIFDFNQFSILLNGGLKKEVDFNSSTKRMAYILKELIESDNFLLIDDLAETLGVSRGTASRDLKDVKEVCRLFGIHIVGTPNKGLKIEGEEFELRLIYLQYVFDYFPTSVFLKEINPFIEKYALIKKIPETSVNTWKKVFEITLNRIFSKHNLSKAIPHYTNYQLDDDTFDELIYEIESIYHISLSQYDIDFLSFPLNISNTGAVERIYMNEEFVRYIFDEMLAEIYSVISVDFDSDYLYEEMRFHLLYLLNRLIFRIENYDYFYGEIEKKYPFSYEVAKIGMKKIEELIGRKASEAEISYLAVYFELKRKKSEPIMKEIAIVCNTGKGTAAMMKQQIKQVLGNNMKIETYTEEEYQQSDLSKYFAVFTTIPLENVDKKTPLIRITNLFNDEWLHSEWRRVQKVNELNFNHIEFAFSQLSGEHSYRSLLLEMNDLLVQKNLVDESFIKRLFNREEIQTTVFSNGVGFPHAINNQSEKVIFHLGVLDNILIENGNEIEFIFMVGIPSSMSDEVEAELLNVYDYMLKVISDKEKSKELHHIQNFSGFISLLREEVS